MGFKIILEAMPFGVDPETGKVGRSGFNKVMDLDKTDLRRKNFRKWVAAGRPKKWPFDQEGNPEPAPAPAPEPAPAPTPEPAPAPAPAPEPAPAPTSAPEPTGKVLQVRGRSPKKKTVTIMGKKYPADKYIETDGDTVITYGDVAKMSMPDLLDRIYGLQYSLMIPGLRLDNEKFVSQAMRLDPSKAATEQEKYKSIFRHPLVRKAFRDKLEGRVELEDIDKGEIGELNFLKKVLDWKQGNAKGWLNPGDKSVVDLEDLPSGYNEIPYQYLIQHPSWGKAINNYYRQTTEDKSVAFPSNQYRNRAQWFYDHNSRAVDRMLRKRQKPEFVHIDDATKKPIHAPWAPMGDYKQPIKKIETLAWMLWRQDVRQSRFETMQGNLAKRDADLRVVDHKTGWMIDDKGGVYDPLGTLRGDISDWNTVPESEDYESPYEGIDPYKYDIRKRLQNLLEPEGIMPDVVIDPSLDVPSKPTPPPTMKPGQPKFPVPLPDVGKEDGYKFTVGKSLAPTKSNLPEPERQKQLAKQREEMKPFADYYEDQFKNVNFFEQKRIKFNKIINEKTSILKEMKILINKEEK